MERSPGDGEGGEAPEDIPYLILSLSGERIPPTWGAEQARLPCLPAGRRSAGGRTSADLRVAQE